MTLEATVEDKVVAWAENNGWLVRKMEYIGRRGCPDRFFWKNGHLVMIEFKRPGKNRADPQQEREHRRLEAAGWKVYVVNSVETAKEILNQYD